MKRLLMAVLVVAMFFSVKNANAVIEYKSDAVISGTIQDASDIIVDPNVTLTMTGDVTFIAGGKFTMNPTSTINGGGHNLTITASKSSYLSTISNVATLILQESVTGSNPSFVFNTPISVTNFTLNSGTVTLLGNLSVNGTATIGTSATVNNTIPLRVQGSADQNTYAISYTTLIGNLQTAYRVADLSDLQAVCDNLTYNYVQTANINSSSVADFAPYMIGNNTSPFTGYFNGNGYIISNLKIKTINYSVGLFGYTSSTAMLSNVGLVSVNINNSGTFWDPVGGLVGYNKGSITNSCSTGRVSAINGGGPVGGLVGCNYNGSISNSYSTGNVSGSYYVGGLVGYNYNGSISNSYSTGSVSGGGQVGGLVGGNDNGGSISNSYSTGNVSGGDQYVGGLVGYNTNGGSISNSYSTGIVSGGYDDVGGLVGINNYNGSISNSYSTGSVSGRDYLGGLVGYESDGGSISNSYSTGNVSGGDQYNGGLVGYNTGYISNSYSTGNVSGSYYVGGLVGGNFSGSTSNSYSTGSVSGSYYVGGLVGYNANNKYIITNCGWWTGAAAQPIGSDSSTVTYNESDPSAFYNPNLGIYAAGTPQWDFVNTWDSFTVTYPQLHWEQHRPPVPVTTVSFSGTSGNNGWYTSNVQITLAATENGGGSGIAKTEYSFNNADWNTYATPFTINTEGLATVYYKSIDNAGNIETPKSIDIKIDKTSPVITIATPRAGVYALNAVILANWTAVDNISGLASTTASATSGSAIDTTSLGSKVFNVTAVDKAGNSSTRTVNYSIALPGDANLDGKVDQQDYNIVFANEGKTGMQWTDGDLNGDGTVDIKDLQIVLAHMTTPPKLRPRG